MPAYAVDSSKQPMVATGVVNARFDWVEAPGGGRRPSEQQARDEATGMPLWGVEVMYQQTTYGRTASVVASVTVSSLDQPNVTALGPIGFEGLRVEVRSPKTGGLIENWFADAIASPPLARASGRVRVVRPRRPRRPDVSEAGVMTQAFGVQVDPVAWTQASGAGSVKDLAAWLAVCCRDADEISERIERLDDELDDLPCQDLSEASVRAWVAIAALRAILDGARRQVLAAEVDDLPMAAASGAAAGSSGGVR